MSRYDTVVIGSGISGMTAALIMAKNGKHTALLESHSFMAPLLQRFKRNGVWCDPGFHYSGGLEETGILTILMAYLGIADKLEVFPLRQDNFDTIRLDDDVEYRMPYGLDALEDYLSSRFPGSRHAIQNYTRKLEDFRNNTPFLNPDLDFMKPTGMESSNTSLQDFLINSGADPGLVRLLGDHGMVLSGVGADEIPLPVHGLIMGSFYSSAHMIAGGGDAIVQAFKNALDEAGVDIYCDTRVNGLRIDEHRRLQAVQTENGNEFECSDCISTMHPQLLVDLLPADKIRPAFINRIRLMENTFSPFIVFYQIDAVPDAVAGSNFYIFKPNRSGERTRDYLAVMGIHPACENAGKKSLSVITACPLDFMEAMFKPNNKLKEEQYFEIKNRLVAKVTAQLLEYLPELKNHIEIVDTATPLTYNRYTGTINGSIYGLKQSVRQSQLTSLTPVHGLFMAGQSVQCGIMGAMISSFMAGCHILDPIKVRSDLNKCR